MSNHSLDLEKLAKLADLKLSDSEKKELEPQLAEVVEYFDQLKNIDTENTRPTSQTTGLVDVTRPDKINPTRILSAEEATSNAKLEHNNYFVVDALLNKD